MSSYYWLYALNRKVVANNNRTDAYCRCLWSRITGVFFNLKRPYLYQNICRDTVSGNQVKGNVTQKVVLSKLSQICILSSCFCMSHWLKTSELLAPSTNLPDNLLCDLAIIAVLDLRGRERRTQDVGDAACQCIGLGVPVEPWDPKISVFGLYWVRSEWAHQYSLTRSG